jgi:hypothetical protein
MAGEVADRAAEWERVEGFAGVAKKCGRVAGLQGLLLVFTIPPLGVETLKIVS